MSYRKGKGVLGLFVCGLALGCCVSLSMAEELEPPKTDAAEIVNQEQEEFAVYFETEGDFFLGYRFLSTEDSLKAAEYLYPHSSASFGLNLLSCPLPYRYHVNAEYISKYDFYSDAGFTYKDLILFRDILVGVHHNLDHYNYLLMGEPPGLIYTDRNTSEDNYIDFASNLMSLRLKTKDFPFHTFIKHRHVERQGRVQQRFLLGYFDELNLVSESRDIDWKSNAVNLGANSHLGPVEIEYAYDQAKFDPGGNYILYDSYPAQGDDGRPADVYPHNVVPETESSAHTVKMHSSYTGGIVAGATVTNLTQKNNYSMTESTTWKGAFDFSWIPDPTLALFFKYRHKDVDMDNPNAVTLRGQNNVLIYPVRQGISYNNDIFSISSRYKPRQHLSLFAKYEFSSLERKDLDEWEILPEQSRIHTVNLMAHAKPIDRVRVKAMYEYKNYDQPSYNTTPDKSNKLKLTGDYTPSPTINIYMEYILTLSDRDNLLYRYGDPTVLLQIGGREGRRDHFLASLAKGFTSKLSFTLSWFYERWETEQDLAYTQWSDTDIGEEGYPYIDYGVPHIDKANAVSLAMQWLPRDDFTVSADVTYTIAKGTNGYNEVVGRDLYSLSSFSDFESEETSCTLDLAKKLSNDWEIGFRSYFNIFNDKTTGRLDGKVFTNTIIVRRYF